MNAGAFVSNSSTHVPAMLHNIIENIDTSKNEVAILVSDMKYSPMGKTAAPELPISGADQKRHRRTLECFALFRLR